MIKYYSILRPIGPGTAPKGAKEIVNYDKRIYVPEIGREAWGYLVYENEIENPEKWDLIKGRN